MRAKLGLCILSILIALPAAAERETVEYLEDGRIQVGTSVYDNVEAFHNSERFRAEGHRCATKSPDFFPRTEPLFADPLDCTFDSTTIQAEYDFDAQTGTVYRVPVVFHMVSRTNGFGEVPLSLVLSQVEVLNEDFRALPGSLGAPGLDTGFEFYLADVDPQGFPTTGVLFYQNDSWFNDPGPDAPNPMKQALNWDPSRYLNIYSNDSAGALGYASFPQFGAGSADDGVVLLWSSIGRDAPGGGIYDKGRTGTHEIGHWLGLFHTFSGQCGNPSFPYTTGDRLADTPSQEFPLFNCPNGSSTCQTLDDIENYMNYTQDTCMNRFTAEQTNRMRCSYVNYRPEIGEFTAIFADDFETGDTARWTTAVGGI